MRTRIKSKVNVQSVIDSIEQEVRAYSKAIKAVMILKQVEYKDAKRILENRLNQRLIFKTN